MHFTPVPNITKFSITAMHYGSRHGHTEDFLMLGTGVKYNKLLKISIAFSVFFLIY